MGRFWMVRAGRGSKLAKSFERKGVVAIGWLQGGDFSALDTPEAMRARIVSAYPGETPQQRATSLAQANKFRNLMAKGDRVVTYDGETREYLIGTITGDYEYRVGVIEGLPHLRAVEWEGRVPKRALRKPTTNTLGAIMTVFEPGEDVLRDIESALRSGRTDLPEGTTGDDDVTAPNLDEVFAEFVAEYLSEDVGQTHKKQYQTTKTAGLKNYTDIIARADRGEDTTDFVLNGLLPHANTERHRNEGQWIHVAPAITKDIRSWYEGAGWVKPEEWPAKAAHILHFIRRVVDQPSQLADACDRFAESPLAKGFQSGMLSPILNALRPEDFEIVNTKVVKAYHALTGNGITSSLVGYPEANEAVKEFVREHSEVLQTAARYGVTPLEAFDMMAHWYVAVREPDNEGEDELPPIVRGPINRDEASDARRVLEALCPDPAPRAVALDALARSIRCAHQLSPGSWSITLHPNVIRFNVSGIMALDIGRPGLYMVVDGPTLDTKARAAVENFDAGDFRFVPSAVGYALPYDELDPAITLLRTAHEQLIRLAIKKSPRAVWQSAHSPGVLQMLRDAGHAVPDPSFYAERRPSPEGSQVSEPTSPPPLPTRRVHEIFSLEQAATDTYLSVSTLESWIRAINRKGQAILYGPPGTGKTFVAERLRRYLLSGGDGHSDLIQFHPAYAYEDFIQGLRPVPTEHGNLNYELVPGRFMEFCEQAADRTGVSVLIIDEINRANLAQVFGELMYLLEYRDKQIPLAGGKSLQIPPNVRIIGTMNTADRSIALVDHALRRRFSFIRLAPNMDVLGRFHSAGGRDVSALITVLNELNERIADPHYSVGISFFMRDKLLDELEGIWTGEIEPYIEELFFDRLQDADPFRWSKVRDRVLA